MRRYGWPAWFGVVLGSLVLIGCESTETQSVAIKISPDMATITESSGSQVFTAAPAATNAALTLPLVWSVSDPNRGNISSSGGLSAVYRRNGGVTGGNTVIVRDQTGAEGVAAVNQL